MSQYGSPPPSDPPGDDDGRTRLPGQRQPAEASPTEEWERPTRQADQPGDSWDQAPGGQQAPWQQPAPYDDEPRTRAADQAPPAAQDPYAAPYGQAGQPGPPYDSYQRQPGQQGGWGGSGPQGPPGGGQGWGGPPQGGPGGAMPSRQETVGFFGALVDFSFTTFVTPMIVKFVYVLAFVALVLGLLAFLVVALATGEILVILFALVLGPVLVLIYLCFIRMTLELYLAITRMSQDINRRLPERS